LPGISAVTVTELRMRLRAEVSEDAEAEDALGRYLNELTVCLPVDRAVAECAWQLRLSASRRIPLIDALIAATARTIGATLVHRDPHMRAIPTGLLEQVELPT
jgi:predicted nucleic acid-binding protein